MIENIKAFGSKQDNSLITLSAVIPAVEDGKIWINIAKEGTWKGHPVGDVVFTHSVFEKIVANFEAIDNDLHLSYGHGAVPGQPRPAAGWLKKMKIIGDQLWALVEPTKRALQMIQDEEYKYCSSVVKFASNDRKTNKSIGAELFEVGLTNTPFIDGLEPIHLSRETFMKTDETTKLADAPAPDAEPDAPQDATQSAPEAAPIDGLKATLGLDEETTDADVFAFLELVFEALGDALQPAIDQAAGKEPAPMEDAPAPDAPVENEAPTKDAVELSAVEELKNLKLENRVDKAINDKLVTVAQRDYLIKLGRTSDELLDEHLKLAAASPAVPEAVTASKPPVESDTVVLSREDVPASKQGLIDMYLATGRFSLQEAISKATAA